MTDPKQKDALSRIASVLEHAQFNNGSLDITLQGPESGFTGCPVVIKMFLVGDTVKEFVIELSEVAAGLRAIADAIRDKK